jgi:hypothetical protein
LPSPYDSLTFDTTPEELVPVVSLNTLRLKMALELRKAEMCEKPYDLRGHRPPAGPPPCRTAWISRINSVNFIGVQRLVLLILLLTS